ncbi:MAG TPA: hypothetical protein VGK67_07290 [Myxococcales bacterium]|jgi:hypothetical protein
MGRATDPRTHRRVAGLRAGSVVVGLLSVLCGSDAHAKELWKSEDGVWEIDLGGHYKSYGAGLLLPGGLVDGTAALSRTLDAAKLQLPAEQANLLPSFDPLPREAGLSTHVARIQGRVLWGARLDFEAAWQIGLSMSSSAAFAKGTALGGAPVGSSSTAKRRMWDFDPVLVESGGFLVQHDLDRLALKLSLPHVDLVVGRQVLSWGSGKLWNPTDLLSPFAPTDIDKEIRKGVDAVRVSVQLGSTGLLDALWLPQQRAADNGGVLRGQLNLGGYDFSLSAAKYVSDVVFGADLSGDLGPLGVHAEAAYTLGITGWSGGPLKVEERFFRGVGGLEWRPHEKLILLAEYYFNGFGATQASGYLAKMKSDRVSRGEIFGAGQHYLGLVASWLASDLLSANLTVLGNLQDPSAMLVPVLEYSVEQSVLVRVGGFIPIGKGPDPHALQALGASDVLGRTAAFQDAVSTLGLRSEYGTSAGGAFVQVAVYR